MCECMNVQQLTASWSSEVLVGGRPRLGREFKFQQMTQLQQPAICSSLKPCE